MMMKRTNEKKDIYLLKYREGARVMGILYCGGEGTSLSCVFIIKHMTPITRGKASHMDRVGSIGK
jgi:heme oxygenase